MSQALSILGDHSGDIFRDDQESVGSRLGTPRQHRLLRPTQRQPCCGHCVTRRRSQRSWASGQRSQRSRNRRHGLHRRPTRTALGTTIDKLASVTTAISGSREDLKQTLSCRTHAFQKFLNIFQPSTGIHIRNHRRNELRQPRELSYRGDTGGVPLGANSPPSCV